ncbi:MAG: zinc-dependent metalloprotease [Actinobacteria bacterium]|nr:zinc-dependent metalloprotease [Actinomycetota bacterium]MDI6832003.1 zinc-dependent metalloprotease [Actinomycetota bacterium]
MVDRKQEDLWQRSLQGVNAFMEGVARRLPLYRSLRRAFLEGGDGMVDWEQAREIAVLVAQSEPAAPPRAAPPREDFEAMKGRSEELVREYSRLEPREPLGPLMVFDRPDWIDANLESFRLIFEPLAESYGRTIGKLEEQRRKPLRAGRALTQGVLTAQLGMVMGYLARNVLGQFDLGLPRPEDGGRLYIVYPNLLKAEEKMRLVPEDFRLWITLHEVTHAFEFAANPWIKGYLRSLMERYFGSVSLRLEEMGMRLRPRELRDSVRLNEIINQGGLISVLHTPEQREILASIQAFMSLVEGYSNLVMDLAGKEVIPSFQAMSAAFRRRREGKSGAERFVERMLGFDLKLQQYQVGELFCREVAEKKGIDFLNRAWKRKEYLPTAEEIRYAFRWIERMEEEERRAVLRRTI